MKLGSVRILEIGDTPFLEPLLPGRVTFIYAGKKHPGRPDLLTWRRFLQLRRELAEGRYDLVVFSAWGVAGVPWRRDRALASNLLRVGRTLGGRFYAFGALAVPWLLRDREVPFVVVDRKDDPDMIPGCHFPLLERCRAYFWREQPVKLETGFFSTSHTEDTSAVRKSALFREHAHKIRPLSLGADPAGFEEVDRSAPKTIDVFFAGTFKGSPVREAGARALLGLTGEGLRIEIRDGVTYPRAGFLRRCAAAWLVWSPEGHGWDCHRHYEACLAGSVPLMNYPRIRRHQPLVEGVHGFYYAPEGDDLQRAVRQALADQPRLREMARAGREHVLAHHTFPRIAEHILRSSLPIED